MKGVGIGQHGEALTADALRALGDVVTTTEASLYLKCSEAHIRRLIATDDLPAIRLGRLIRLRVSDLLALTGADR